MKAELPSERHFLHDISSPLTALQLSLENLRLMQETGNSDDLEECKKLLKVCLAQTARMSGMILDRRKILTDKDEK